jgi:hypothetical protein
MRSKLAQHTLFVINTPIRQNFSQQRWAKLNPLPAFNGFSESESSSTNLSKNGNGWLKMAVHPNSQSSEDDDYTFRLISRGKNPEKT